MTKGDIIRMPSGKFARYEGGGQYGAEFVYLDDTGIPVWDSHNQCQDTFCIASMAVLIKLQPEVSRV